MARTRWLRREHGQATVEFALVLPVLIMVLFAIAQLGLALHAYISLTDAVRVGARHAAVSRTLPEPDRVATTRAAVVTAADLDLEPADVSVASSWERGSTVTVSARYRPTILGIEFDLTSETTVRVE